MTNSLSYSCRLDIGKIENDAPISLSWSSSSVANLSAGCKKALSSLWNLSDVSAKIDSSDASKAICFYEARSSRWP